MKATKTIELTQEELVTIDKAHDIISEILDMVGGYENELIFDDDKDTSLNWHDLAEIVEVLEDLGQCNITIQNTGDKK